MKHLALFLLVTIIGLTACKDKEKNPEKETAEEQKVTADVAPDRAKDSAGIRKVITDFYNWYNTNYTKFQTYDLYSSTKKKNAPPYKINWDEVEKYQQFIHTSVPQLGEEFLLNQKRFFQECDSAFKVDIEDEIPYGFDYDWYTNSQEDAQYLVDEINKAQPWSVSWSGDYATVAVKGSYDNNGKEEEATFVTLTMKKENGEWKIAKIGAGN